MNTSCLRVLFIQINKKANCYIIEQIHFNLQFFPKVKEHKIMIFDNNENQQEYTVLNDD